MVESSLSMQEVPGSIPGASKIFIHFIETNNYILLAIIYIVNVTYQDYRGNSSTFSFKNRALQDTQFQIFMFQKCFLTLNLLLELLKLQHSTINTKNFIIFLKYIIGFKKD